MPRWAMDIIRRRAEHLGTVEAPDEKAAIEKAAEMFSTPAGAAEPDHRSEVRQQEIDGAYEEDGHDTAYTSCNHDHVDFGRRKRVHVRVHEGTPH